MSEPCLQTKTSINPAEHAAQIITEYENFIRWVIRSQNIDENTEDDLFQDFYLALIANPIPEDVVSIKSYLYKAIIYHITRSQRKITRYNEKIKKFRKKNCFCINKINSTGALLNREEINEMFETIKEIVPGQKYVAITLRYRDGYSIKEVADKMDLKNASVRHYISKGLGKVRKCLNNI